jgi:hypothetical protein
LTEQKEKQENTLFGSLGLFTIIFHDVEQSSRERLCYTFSYKHAAKFVFRSRALEIENTIDALQSIQH